MRPRLKLMVFDTGGGLCLFVRLPGGERLVVDCTQGGPSPLSFLRRRGEVGPVHPVTAYLRPRDEDPDAGQWLALLGLLRGLVVRPGGSWLSWRPAKVEGPGFGLSARVSPSPPSPVSLEEGGRVPLLVLGLTLEQVADLGGGPQAWVANSSPALMVPGTGLSGGDFLLGGDLRPGAWQRLLADPSLGVMLNGVGCFGGGEPEDGFSFGRGLVMACLPWLVLGAMAAGSWALPEPGMERQPLCTPETGGLSIEVAGDGLMHATGWPQGDNRLTWRGLARPLADAMLPAPWPLRRALAGN